ncbi:MAG: beta-ketoacyl synthase [Flavobacteriales bacterium TMED288]|nr:beta-ketoacyl synthase [Flavobacteriales bacterium]MAJ98497.1 beta-ketoacyl synthase [Flavobacteriales bacterium]RPG53858.1 MAG: beta-ketoacyl synthase [Flavobacteriales bacterium TMED288]|tara:strand:+ start:3608 stop:4783 length:1176 start_codon:yes stop_codon:yes gene_type:complete
MQEDIIISGFGSISCLGSEYYEIWNNYLTKKTRLSFKKILNSKIPIGILDKNEKEKIIEIQRENKFYKRLDKSVLMSIFASRKAIKSSNWKKSSKLSLNIGSSRGATELFEKYHKDFLNNKSSKLSPISSPNTSLGNISTWVAYDIGFKGFSFSHSITCSTALHSILNGIAWLKSGMSKRFIAGASEAPITNFTISQMKSLNIYSNKLTKYPCQPFNLKNNQNTMVVSEGASSFCLELQKKQNKKRVVKIAGYGYFNEKISHNTSINKNGIGLYNTMKIALNMANLNTVDCIITHAPGTILGDKSEFNAIKKLFGKFIPRITSNKHIMGHSFSNSGGSSIEMGIMMLKNNYFIDLPFETIFENKNLNSDLNSVMINSTGFGGNSVSIILTL